MTRITGKDVARLAGVSQTTVSFVLNGRNLESIPAATREAVWDAARELNFIPSSAARALRKGRNDVILCLVPDFASSEIMERFKLTLSANLAGSGLVCVFFHYAGLSNPIEALLGRFNPALVLSFKHLDQAQIAPLEHAGIPVINGLFSDQTAIRQGAWIDQEAIGRMQAEHLLQRGDRSIAFVGIDDPREVDFCEPRQRGVQQACRNRRMPEPLILLQSDYTMASSQAILYQLRDHLAKPIAIAAFNDLAAISLLAAARVANISVPDHLAIIGVDDNPAAALFSPSLTTIQLDIAINVATVNNLVLERLGLTVDSQSCPVKTGENQLPLKLIQRDST